MPLALGISAWILLVAFVLIVVVWLLATVVAVLARRRLLWAYRTNRRPKAFERARRHTDSAAYIKDSFGLLEEKATVQIERYGYYQDRIAFECGALSPCTIHIGDGFLEFSKPGVVTEHVVLYRHVDSE